MNFNRSSTTRSGTIAVGIAAAAALTLSACSGGGGSSDSGSTGAVSNGGTISGEGSTAQQKAIEIFQDVLTKNGGTVLNYTGSGSGDGVKKFLSKDVDFAGSDSALKGDEITKAKDRCGGNDAWHIPLVAGPVSIAYNLDGVDDLTLTPSLIAKIFDSKITKWNDPAIAAVNAGVSLPDKAIVPVHRSDSSGTTDNFQRFLQDTAKADWPYEHDKLFKGQGGSGAAKSTGVGDTVKKTSGAVTYVEWGYAKQNDLGLAKVDFGSGAVELNDDSAGKALEGVTFKTPGSKDLVVDTDKLFASNGAGAWPLLLTSYEIVCSKGYDGNTAATLKSAFNVILEKGQDGLSDAGYVELPESYKTTLKGTIDALS
ncbi:phosphate ABC transporter substrate-binding protein PstS [Williamsia sp. CHRR-6]|uniref:phosphate ABC transporter substrate-binding protein PstS n=1 Tax=Williamsia sp. CHRR-6 TaxID=2835871 RepID=UPI001BD9BD4B|nr:phosphate ABC transporter substrate-binding protein PstS [Williamsia sp. CHRR-6]MBT0566335.1 phosphate ABC transporter substrate-binding protein PstS [Williamsia sp. CHRR-6]